MNLDISYLSVKKQKQGAFEFKSPLFYHQKSCLNISKDLTFKMLLSLSSGMKRNPDLTFYLVPFPQRPVFFLSMRDQKVFLACIIVAGYQ